MCLELGKGESMEIYVDVIFLINSIMNTLIFFITSKVLKMNTGFFRAFIFGLLSSVMYIIVAFFVVSPFINNGITQFIIICLNIFLFFRPKNIVSFVKEILAFHIFSFVIGGIGLYILYFFNYENILGNGFTFNFNAPIILFFGLSVFSYAFLSFLNKYLKKYLMDKQAFARVKVSLNGKSTELKALIDTGNTLHCPLTNTPVLVVEFQTIKSILPNDMKLIFYENRDNDISNFGHCFQNINIRLIPFKSVGNRNGILIGFIPDEMIINIGKEIINIHRGKGVVGICNFKLSNWDYSGLLSPEFLENN